MSTKTKLKLAAATGVLCLVLFGIWALNTDFFGRSISRATAGVVATKYQVPDGAIEVLSVSFSEYPEGGTSKNIAYLMGDCTVEIHEYRDGFKGFLDSTTKLMNGLKPFRDQRCLREQGRPVE